MSQSDFTFDQHLEFCFLPPCPPTELPPALHNPELRPVVHLLRRDLELIYGPEEEAFCPASMKPPLVVLLAMLCGFDMLAAMLSGEDPIDEVEKEAQALLKANGYSINIYQVNRKYQLFLREIAGLNEQEAALLLVLRNSLAHTYSLNVNKKAYRNNSVTADRPNGKLITILDETNPKKYIVNLWELKACFLKSVASFKEHLESSAPESESRGNFTTHMKESGYIHIEGAAKRPTA